MTPEPAPATPTLADDERTLLHVAAAGGPLAEPLARILAEYANRGARIHELEARAAHQHAPSDDEPVPGIGILGGYVRTDGSVTT